MKTQFDQINALYKILDESSIKTVINGAIYKLRRPVNSKKEDVVINSVTIGEGNVQAGVVNVNIHVPDIKVKIDGDTQSQPNTKRLGELTALAFGILEEVCSDEYSFYIASSNIIEESEINSHFQNIRIIFTFYNT